MCSCAFSRFYWVNAATFHPLGVVLLPETYFTGFLPMTPHASAGMSHPVPQAPPSCGR